MMTYRLAAERADLVAAMVPVGGAMALASLDPARPVPLLHIHSVDDPRALYHGGTGPPFPGTNNRVDHRAVMAGLEAWAAHNGCTTPPSTGAPRRGSGADRDQTVMLVEWSGCAAGGSVQHLRLTGVGHGWPGAPVRPGMRAVIGPGTALIDAGAEAWNFASRFRR
jgi:polyhydroxybutyrate depolymerase